MMGLRESSVRVVASDDVNMWPFEATPESCRIRDKMDVLATHPDEFAPAKTYAPHRDNQKAVTCGPRCAEYPNHLVVSRVVDGGFGLLEVVASPQAGRTLILLATSLAVFQPRSDR